MPTSFGLLNFAVLTAFICWIFQPLARLGAEVTGIDASAELIKVAEWHAELDSSIRSRVTFKVSTIEDLCSNITASEHACLYDGVVASEIVEHVSDAKLFVNACCSLVKVVFFIKCYMEVNNCFQVKF